MSTAAPFAFLVHPRARVAEDLARIWRPLGRVPERLIDTAVRRLPLPPYAMSRVHLDDQPVGHVVLIGGSPVAARHVGRVVEVGLCPEGARTHPGDTEGSQASGCVREMTGGWVHPQVHTSVVQVCCGS